MLKDDGEAENSASADEESPKPIIEEADSGLPCTHSIGAAGSIQSCNPTLMKQSSCSTNLNHHGWKIYSFPFDVKPGADL